MFGRSIHVDEVLSLIRDPSVTALEGVSVTATNFIWIGGANFSIQIPLSLSAHGGLNIEVNNSNYITPSLTGTIKYTTNPLFNQPQLVTQKSVGINPSFSGNWISIATINDGIAFRSINNVSARFLRLRGAGVTASNFVAYAWSDINVQGN